ncbi:MAG: asparagine synthase-related protein [Thermoanaerobaculia bacterium]|nr:asparagine synthase-related protein [Thermoanaerobaculia bacterium]
MSALGGVLSLRGAPVPDVMARRIASGLAQIGPDGEAWHHDDLLSLVFRPFHVGADDGKTRQPWSDLQGLVVAWNGRLDNAAELRRMLGVRRADGPRLVAAAYRRFGKDCVRHLVGDFSLAVWDPLLRRLLLATDPFALRPIFFHSGSDFFLFASRARTLVEAAGLSTTLDDVGVAAFLTFIDAGHRTVLRDVRMLPGAHWLTVEEGVVRLERYWSPADRSPVRYSRDEGYEDHFAQVFRQAVTDRLVAETPVWADLSGGLDSSSIVCVADRVLAGSDNQRLASRLETVSYVYERNRSCDEREYLQTVETLRGRRGFHIRDDEVPTLTPIPAHLQPDLPSGQLPFHNRYRAQYDAMSRLGSRVLLRGSGGDHVLWGEALAAFELADLLATGRPREAWRRAKSWAHQRREPLFKTLWQGGIWPLLPRRIRAATGFVHTLDDWFDPDFVRRVDLPGRLLGEDDHRFALPSQRLQWAWIAGVGRYVGWEMPLARGCVESRYPFLDRRLVELALAMPMDQKLRPGETRSVLRRALRGVLPDKVRHRTSKSGPDEAIYRALTRESRWLAELFRDARVCRHGFVHPAALERALTAARHGVMLNSPQLLRALTLEFWIRSVEGAAPALPRSDGDTYDVPGTAPTGVPDPSRSSDPGVGAVGPPKPPAQDSIPARASTAASRGTSEVDHEAILRT